MADRVRVIDETLREGMQFHGLVFSLKQRLRILEFQEELGVDVCQAGYPPALDREAEVVRQVADHAREKNMAIRTAALGRALARDARIIRDTGVDDPHFHFHLAPDVEADIGPEFGPNFKSGRLDAELNRLAGLLKEVHKQLPAARISLAMLDIGRTSPGLLETCIRFLDRCPGLSILSLPDTSGILAPPQMADGIAGAATLARRIQLAVHCHNDMGMASANTLMGILSGARVLEASALGIGERNGIADLFTTARMLKDLGLNIRLDTDNVKGFRTYYAYVNQIVKEQTGLDLMGYACPVFGDAVSTHVAGTHANAGFGSTVSPAPKEDFHLNLLCGRSLVRKYLDLKGIAAPDEGLDALTLAIKHTSLSLGRALKKEEVAALARSSDKGLPHPAP